jgi:2-oxoglutarate decarboxylase
MPDDPETSSSNQASTFGANAWLVDEMYEQYRADPESVSGSWREFFQGYRPGGVNLAGR